jgi:hypothetical protein
MVLSHAKLIFIVAEFKMAAGSTSTNE